MVLKTFDETGKKKLIQLKKHYLKLQYNTLNIFLYKISIRYISESLIKFRYEIYSVVCP